MHGGHLLLSTQRSRAAGEPSVLFRRLAPSGLTGISEDQRNRCCENLVGTQMNRTRAVLAYVLPEDRPNMRK
jgi:hypothetical protein